MIHGFRISIVDSVFYEPRIPCLGSSYSKSSQKDFGSDSSYLDFEFEYELNLSHHILKYRNYAVLPAESNREG